MMIQSIRRDSYGARRLFSSRRAPASSSVQSPRRGFTLIEVVVAMSILVVVVLALVSNYYAYYGTVQSERYKTVGQNLAQLQLEDIQALPVSVLEQIVGESSVAPGFGFYPNPSDVSGPPNYSDVDSASDVFDSGKIPGEFRLYDLVDVGTLSTASIPGVGIEPALNPSQHNLVLYANIYPGYKKRVVITDMTSGMTGTISEYAVTSRKLFKIDVTVFWTTNGVEKKVTVSGLKNDLG